jgi:mannose-6-phosphate isomerase-like protein (cupin superfamily)
MRALWVLCLASLVAAGCTTREPPAEPVSRSAAGDMDVGGEATSVEQEAPAPAGASVQDRGILQGPDSTTVERGPVMPLMPAEAPAVLVPALLGQLRLQPGGRFEPPANACQDVLIFVREGTLEATGPGIAPLEAPTTLYAGDAVRFGPEGPGVLINVGDAPARTVVAFARPEGVVPAFETSAGLHASLAAPPSNAAACPRVEPDADPRVRSLRVASVETTEPLVVAGGKMRVRILLDADGQGARFGGLAWLEADADVRVPEHTHPDSAEILLIEEGDGVMRLGDRQVRVHPGAAIYVPKGVIHDFRSAGTRPLRAIQVYAPSGPEQRFRTQAAAAPASPAGPR